MSGVDVLAVMLTQQKHDESRGLWEPAAVMETARAAVAELIEASEYVSNYVANYSALTYSSTACKEANERIRTAIARVTGGSYGR